MKGAGTQRKVDKDLLKFRWSIECPDCGSMSTAMVNPGPGSVSPGAAVVKWSSSWAGGGG